jgi:carbamoyltransferase
VLINTSFNIRGEPIVCTPADAYRCFMATEMDVLVMDSLVLRKEEQPAANAQERERYHASFGRD